MGRKRDGEGGGKCSSRDQPPLPTSHCARDKTRARLSSHAHAHGDDPSPLPPGAAEKASRPFPDRALKLSELRAQPSANPEAEESRRTSLLSPLPARLRRPIPRPEPRSFPPHPSGFHADSARSGVCP